MLIGIDFDNTTVCYDDAFHRAAVKRDLIPPTMPPSKDQIRNHLRQLGREDEWTELQGHVYGIAILHALPYAGVVDFLKRCKQQAAQVRIISHKTHHPFRGPQYDLHQAAFDWLQTNRFFDPIAIGLSPDYVFFEKSKERKLARIAEVCCTHFIDDLPEFLAEADFPAEVQRILFDPHDQAHQESRFARAASWKQIAELVL